MKYRVKILVAKTFEFEVEGTYDDAEDEAIAYCDDLEARTICFIKREDDSVSMFYFIDQIDEPDEIQNS